MFDQAGDIVKAAQRFGRKPSHGILCQKI